LSKRAIFRWFWFPQVVHRLCVRWKIERLFNGKLSQEYLYGKLSKSDNLSSSYNRKCLGCFFWDTVYCCISCCCFFCK